MDLTQQTTFFSLLPATLFLFTLTHYCKANTLSFAKSQFLQNSVRTNLCPSASCDACASACPSSSEIAKDNAYCRQIQPFLRKSSLNHAYINCTRGTCEWLQTKQACGLIHIDPRHTTTSQVETAVKKTWERVTSLNTETSKFDEANPLNPKISLYYQRALQKIQQCNAMFRKALSVRARNIKLREYLKSLEYRRVNQEVTRFKFENDDLRRHLNFWEKQHKTLSLAVRTSPQGLKDARDALLNEMLSYQADAQLISVLQNASLSKEERAELVIKLRESVQNEIDLARTQHAHLLREEQFIRGARMEIFYMLRDVLLKLRSGLISVRCGGDTLSDIVGGAIMSGQK